MFSSSSPLGHRDSPIASALLPLFLLGYFAAAQAADFTCDSALSAPAGHPYGYSVRGNRCEGVYVQPVRSTGSLVVASLTARLPTYDLAETRTPLVVGWNVPAEASVRLRARGLRRRLYYRMDALVPAGDSFQWPSNVLSSLQLSTSEIGLLGWMDYRFDESEREIYLPLSVRAEGDDWSEKKLQLTLIPRQELKELYVSLAILDSRGETQEYLRDGEALGYGYYPAGRPVKIPIPGLQKPGFYYLEIGAELSGGVNDALELTFYYGGG